MPLAKTMSFAATKDTERSASIRERASEQEGARVRAVVSACVREHLWQQGQHESRFRINVNRKTANKLTTVARSRSADNHWRLMGWWRLVEGLAVGGP
jgi:hypothetical protein